MINLKKFLLTIVLPQVIILVLGIALIFVIVFHKKEYSIKQNVIHLINIIAEEVK